MLIAILFIAPFTRESFGFAGLAIIPQLSALGRLRGSAMSGTADNTSRPESSHLEFSQVCLLAEPEWTLIKPKPEN